MPTTVASHIVLDEKGRAVIEGTTMKVTEVALEKIARDWDADQIHLQHPYLPLAKIHGALSYYYDHKEQLDAEIERVYHEVIQMAARADLISPVRNTLRKLGLLPKSQ